MDIVPLRPHPAARAVALPFPFLIHLSFVAIHFFSKSSLLSAERTIVAASAPTSRRWGWSPPVQRRWNNQMAGK